MPKIKLTTSYPIYASHRLYRADWTDAQNQKAFGHCSRLHGHQYRLEVVLSGEIDPDTGMLLNGYEVDRIIRDKILSKLDHRDLNSEVEFFKAHQPTAEWIAVWIYDEIKSAFPANCRVKRVRVYETPDLCSEYGGD